MATFFTVQHRKAWAQAQRCSFLTGNAAHISPGFEKAYAWMMGQMAQRLPFYAGEYPIWLWPEKQDLRGGAFGPPHNLVQLEVTIDPEQVLLSDFQAWHAVLNDFPILAFEGEAVQKERSWERIFDFEFLTSSPNWGPPELQGVTGRVWLGTIEVVRSNRLGAG